MQRAEYISHRLKLRQLRVLLAVAQFGSMAKAAEHLAISQPVVSKAIADLEQLLGVRLLDRGPHGVEPTLYGRVLVKRSTAIFNDLRTSVTELEHLSDPTAGELRIGSSEAVAAGMLGVIIDNLSEQHPRLIFEVTLGGGLTDLQYRELQGHNLDLVIGRLPSVLPDDTEAEILYYDPSFVVAGQQSPWARRRKIDLADLVNESWCLPMFDTFPWTRIADAFCTRHLALPHRIVTTRSILLMTTLVETGGFLTILPRTVVHFCAKKFSLKILPVALDSEPYPVGIVTIKDRTRNPVATLFQECARRVANTFAERPSSS
jgi:DNA-binding transcriptional LysR family regulator